MVQFDPFEVVVAGCKCQPPCPELWSQSDSESEYFSFTDTVDLDCSEFTSVIRNPGKETVGPGPGTFAIGLACDMSSNRIFAVQQRKLPHVDDGGSTRSDGY